MRVYGPSGTRNIPQDRGPSTVTGTATFNGAGASTVIGASYTVPANRRAFISVASIFGLVTVAMAAGQTAFAEVIVTPSGGAAGFVDVDRCPAASALGVKLHAQATQLWLKAGDAVDVRVAEDAGVGVVTCAGGFEGVEFDA